MADEHESGVDRRGALQCMLWAGTGVLWTVAGGVPKSGLLGSAQAARRPASPSCRFPTAMSASTSRPTPTRSARCRKRSARSSRLPVEARLHDPHRRHHPSVEAQAIRRRRSGDRRGEARRALRAGRTRRHRRGAGQGLSRPLRQARQGRGLVFLRSGRRRISSASSMSSTSRPAAWAISAPTSSPGWRTIWRARAHRRRSSSSRIFRSGRSRRNGAGARRIRRRRSRCSRVSARSPCSTDISIRSCRRSKATSPFTPRARPPFRSRRPARRRRRPEARSGRRVARLAWHQQRRLSAGRQELAVTDISLAS